MDELALTVCQPWAWAIIHGPKRWENREWELPRKFWGKRIWIHAGKSKKWMAQGLAFFESQGLQLPTVADRGLYFGGLVGCVRLSRCDASICMTEDDPWAFGPWCWRCDEPRAIAKPVACKGQLGIWKMPAEVAAACVAQLADPHDAGGEGRSSGGELPTVADRGLSAARQGRLWG